MSAKCTICASKHRVSIDLALVHLLSHRAISARFQVSASAVKRHAANHLTATQRAALLSASTPTAIDLPAMRTAEAEGLLGQLIGQRARLRMLADMAAGDGDYRASASCEAGITSNLTLVARLLQQLVNVHDVRTTHVLISPEYMRLRSVLVHALKAHPAAALDVSRALYALESEAAADITNAATRKPAPLTIEHQAAEAPIAQVTAAPANAQAPSASPTIPPPPPYMPPPPL